MGFLLPETIPNSGKLNHLSKLLDDIVFQSYHFLPGCQFHTIGGEFLSCFQALSEVRVWPEDACPC